MFVFSLKQTLPTIGKLLCNQETNMYKFCLHLSWFQSTANELSSQKSLKRKKYIHRHLGLLETLYHKNHIFNSETFVSIMTVSSPSLIKNEVFKEAIIELVKYHPILTMEIMENDREYFFDAKENFEPRHHLEIIQNKVYKSMINIKSHRSTSNLAWKLWVEQDQINANSNYINFNTLKLYFTCQHAFADFQYIFHICCTFLEIVSQKLMQKNDHNTVNSDKKSSISTTNLPCTIEEAIGLDICTLMGDIKQKLRRSESHIYQIPDTRFVNGLKKKCITSLAAIDAYTHCTGKQYDFVCKYESKHEILSLSPGQTSALLSSCSKNNISVTGALMACSALAFRHILYTGNVPFDATIMTISLEVLASLRRFIPKHTLRWSFPGCTAIHIPFQMNVSLNDLGNEEDKELIETAQNCSFTLKHVISSCDFLPKIYHNVQTDINSLSGKRTSQCQKSEYVLCVSNVGDISYISQYIKSPDMFQLLEIDLEYDITGKDMPIFLCSTVIIDKCLYLNIQYSLPFTDISTADTFVHKLKTMLCKI